MSSRIVLNGGVDNRDLTVGEDPAAIELRAVVGDDTIFNRSTALCINPATVDIRAGLCVAIPDGETVEYSATVEEHYTEFVLTVEDGDVARQVAVRKAFRAGKPSVEPYSCGYLQHGGGLISAGLHVDLGAGCCGAQSLLEFGSG